MKLFMLLLFVLICQDVFASDSYYRIPPKTTIEPSQLNGARKIIAENFSTLYITIMGAVDYRTPEKAPRYSEWVMVWRGVYPTSEVFLHYES